MHINCNQYSSANQAKSQPLHQLSCVSKKYSYNLVKANICTITVCKCCMDYVINAEVQSVQSKASLSSTHTGHTAPPQRLPIPFIPGTAKFLPPIHSTFFVQQNLCMVGGTVVVNFCRASAFLPNASLPFSPIPLPLYFPSLQPFPFPFLHLPLPYLSLESEESRGSSPVKI